MLSMDCGVIFVINCYKTDAFADKFDRSWCFQCLDFFLLSSAFNYDVKAVFSPWCRLVYLVHGHNYYV